MDGTDKTFAEIAGKPVIAHTIEVFEASPLVSEIILVLPIESVAKGVELVSKYRFSKVSYICNGGATRQESVSQGLKHVRDCDFILVHDGARPCVTQDAIEKGILEAGKNGIAIPGAEVTDTIKQVDEEECVLKTVERKRLRAVHTPQVFRAKILQEVHRRAEADASDDAVLAEKMGYKVKVYDDSPENMKITRRGDLAIAEAILLRRGS